MTHSNEASSAGARNGHFLSKREESLLAALILVTLSWAIFSQGLSFAQTTSVDIQVLSFPGVQVGTSGILVGNLSAAFSFIPNSGFQRVISSNATIVYQVAPASAGCSPCHFPGDNFAFEINGLSVGSMSINGGVSPTAGVANWSNVRMGQNLVRITTVNSSSPSTGSYYVYEVRVSVLYSFT